ncbi:MAG: ActS/PrrB/RegB family redox-sensitive histidine kinase [Alphaproteobacteria bacterium]|nr:ActS/PrrB/RegB family redox-sensitive histidine kinase [Alphaproteobacteria bacterium]
MTDALRAERRAAATQAMAPGFSAGRLRLRTLVLIRWVAVLGQAGTVLFVHLGLGFDLPLAPVAATIFAAAVSNVIIAMVRPPQSRLSDRDGAFYLAFDILQLALLLFLTGGVANPFAILLLAPVAIAAATLSGPSTIGLSGLSLAAICVLGFVHLPLPWIGAPVQLPPIYQLGVTVALIVATLFIAFYAWSLSNAQRRMQDALAAAQAALAREQRLSALGGLAAAAAHELGSPLSTIAVVTSEIKRSLPADSPIAEDIALLDSQSRRCRDILARLAQRPEQAGGAPYELLPLGALVRAAMSDPDRPGAAVVFAEAAEDGTPEPTVRRSPEILHALGNLIENAREFARAEVSVTTRWNARTVNVVVADDGPGFAADILGELGEPYLTSRRASGHMGLGLFIAKTLLEHTGARLKFANRPQGGAEIAISWPRDDIQASD